MPLFGNFGSSQATPTPASAPAEAPQTRPAVPVVAVVPLEFGPCRWAIRKPGTRSVEQAAGATTVALDNVTVSQDSNESCPGFDGPITFVGELSDSRINGKKFKVADYARQLVEDPTPGQVYQKVIFQSDGTIWAINA